MSKPRTGIRSSGYTVPRAPRPAVRSTTKPQRELALPHERDESPRSESAAQRGPRGRIRQAARDVECGLIDTEARGTPSNVPSRRARTARSA